MLLTDPACLAYVEFAIVGVKGIVHLFKNIFILCFYAMTHKISIVEHVNGIKKKSVNLIVLGLCAIR